MAQPEYTRAPQATSPITSRNPHSGITPPSSPIASIHLNLLSSDPSDAVPRPRSISPAYDHPTPKASNGWTWSWSGSSNSKIKGKGKAKVEDEVEPITPTSATSSSSSQRIISINKDEPALGPASDRRGKKRTLSGRLEAAKGEVVGIVKRRMSGVGGIRHSDDRSLGDTEDRRGGMGRILRSRLRQAGKKGNLPFVIIFVGCLIIFLSALAGIGYEPPEPYKNGLRTTNSAAASFQLGQPVYEGVGNKNGKEIMAERRKMEEMWGKKKRPKDGAWMQKQRDTGAVRRKAKMKDLPSVQKEVPKKVQAEDKPAPIAPAIVEQAKELGDKT